MAGQGLNPLSLGGSENVGAETSQSSTTDQVDVTKNRVYVWGANGNFLESIDPTNTTTGLQDALDLIKTQGDTAGGKVFIPAETTVEQSQTIPNDHLRTVRLEGAGPSSVINFTGSGAGFTINPTGGFVNSYIDNVKVADNRSSTGNALFHFTGTAGNFNVGSIVGEWDTDPAVHFDTGNMFESDWDYARFSGDGRQWHMENQNGPGNEIDTLILRNDNATDSTFEYDQGGGTLSIGTLYHGSPVPEGAVKCLINNNGLLDIDTIHLEDSTNGTITEPIDFEGGYQRVGTVNLTGNSTFSRGVSLSFSHGGARIGRIIGSATITDKLYLVNDADEAVTYGGLSSDVNNQSGSSLSNPVACIGDGVYKFSTGTGYTHGTDILQNVTNPLTAKDTGTVDGTYGTPEADVIKNNRTRIEELEQAIFGS